MLESELRMVPDHGNTHPLYPQPVNVTDGAMGEWVSHGCVRLNLEDAKYIYDEMPYGTKVYVYN